MEMYKYTQEQLDSMKKVQATREERLKNLFARMSADEKQTVLKENQPNKYCVNLYIPFLTKRKNLIYKTSKC